MDCPYCNDKMIIGRIDQDRYALKWVPLEKSKGLLNFTPFVKGIKLTSGWKNNYITTYYCENCRRFIINGSDIAY